MNTASWILIVWLVIQLFVRLFRAGKKHKEPMDLVGSGAGCCLWLAGMVYLIHLSGGWN